jgi:hypothetical protein
MLIHGLFVFYIWLLYVIDTWICQHFILNKNMDFQSAHICRQRVWFTSSNNIYIAVRNLKICISKMYICRTSSLIPFSVHALNVLKLMISSMASQTLRGWVGGGVGVCVCVRAPVQGVGGKGALAPRRGWCRRSAAFYLLNRRYLDCSECLLIHLFKRSWV